MKKIFILDLFLLFLLTILFFSKIIFFDHFFCSTSELLVESFSFHVYIGNVLRTGILPIWDPYYCLAFPALSFTSAFYPFALILGYLGSFLTLNQSFFLLQLGLLFHVYLAGVFMYIFLTDLKLHRLSVWFGTVAFTYSSCVVHAAHYAGFCYSLIWFPLIFYFFTKAIDAISYKFSILCGIIVGMALLGGHPPIVFYMCGVLLFYFFWSVVYDITTKKVVDYRYLLRITGVGITTMLIALGLAAVFLLPTFEYNFLSCRFGQSYKVISAWASVTPLYLITLIFPHFFGGAYTQHWGWRYTSLVGWWEMMFYVGTGVLVMAGISLFLKYGGKLDKMHRFLVLLSVLSLFFMMGQNSAALGMLYALKVVPITRIVSRWGFFLIFSLCTLAAMGFNAFCVGLTEKTKEDLRKVLRFLIKPLTITMLVGIIGLTFALLNKGYFQSLRSIAQFLIFYSFTVVFLFMSLRRNQKLLRVTFLLVCFTDVFLASYRVYPLIPNVQPQVLPSRAFYDNELVRFLKNDKGIYRISGLPHPLFEGHINKFFTMGYLCGYSYQRFAEFRGENNPMGSGGHDWLSVRPDVYSNLIDFYNIKYLISERPLDYFDPKYERIYSNVIDPIYTQYEYPNVVFHLFRNKNAFERSFLVFNYEVIDDKEILQRMEEVDLSKTVILEEEPHTPLPNVNTEDESEHTSEVTINKYSPTEIIINCNSDRPAFLVLSDVWYPGWKAFVDGRLAKIYRANYIFRAIELDEGKHAVKFKYDPFSIKLGAAISAITIIILILSGLLFLRKRE